MSDTNNYWDKYFEGRTDLFKKNILIRETKKEVNLILKTQREYAKTRMLDQSRHILNLFDLKYLTFTVEQYKHIKRDMWLPINCSVSIELKHDKVEIHGLETPDYKTRLKSLIYYKTRMRLGNQSIMQLNRMIGMENPADHSQFDDLDHTFTSGCPDWDCTINNPFGSNVMTNIVTEVYKGFERVFEVDVDRFIREIELEDYILALQNSIKHRWGYITEKAWNDANQK